MAKWSKKQEQTLRLDVSRPYANLENHDEWSVIKTAILEMVRNEDIELLTDEHYVIGYLCKKIIENKEAQFN